MSVTEKSNFALGWHDGFDLDASQALRSLLLLEVHVVIGIFQLVVECFRSRGALLVRHFDQLFILLQIFHTYGVLGFWGFGVLGFWGFGEIGRAHV